MATRVSTVTVQSSDPGDGAMSGYQTRETTASRDISVSLTEGRVISDGKGGGYLQLVLQINADAGASVGVDGNGGVSIRATNNSPVTQYVLCNMDSADPNNWTLNVGTSGGSTFTFTKGSGGGGH